MVEIKIYGERVDVRYNPPTAVSTSTNLNLNEVDGKADGVLAMLSSLSREELQIIEQFVKRYLNES